MLKMELARNAREYLGLSQLDGWLIYEYQRINPVFYHFLGEISMITRPCFLWIPQLGHPTLVAHHVDIGRYNHTDINVLGYTGRQTLEETLVDLLRNSKNIAMEYSPMATIPRVSLVDAGTLEMVKNLGVEVFSSADLLQYSIERWKPNQLESHMRTANTLTSLVNDTFTYISENVQNQLTEIDVSNFITRSSYEYGLEMPDGPVVAVDHHSSDPHYIPELISALTITHGSWLLIDLWAKEKTPEAVFADLTWVAYVGEEVPDKYKSAFEVVIGARDMAVEFLSKSFTDGKLPMGWEVDMVAREYIVNKGYGDYFTHRLGHSLGSKVHGDAVNLDSWETYDSRTIMTGLGVTVEPGVYMKDFGMRSEINLFIAETGPYVTSRPQDKIVLIEG